MRSITSDENSADSISISQCPFDDPMARCNGFDFQIWNLEQITNLLQEFVFLKPVLIIEREAKMKDPLIREFAPIWSHGDDSATGKNRFCVSIYQMTGKESIIPVLREVGVKVYRNHIDKTSWSLSGNANSWSDRSSTISSNKVLSAILGDMPVDVFDSDLDPHLAFMEVFHESIEKDSTWVLGLCMMPQNWLHPAKGQVDGSHWGIMTATCISSCP